MPKMPKETMEEFTKRMRTITVPSDFATDFETHPPFQWEENGKDWLEFKLYSADVKITFDQGGNGHTSFLIHQNGKPVWLTFDRRGVDDSFYHWPYYEGQKIPPLDEIVAEQLAQIAKRREYYTTAIVVPGLPGNFTVAPDALPKLKKQLANKRTGSLSFTPAGFGTGYCITRVPTRGCKYGESRAKRELEEFLGYSPLYVHTLDCD